MMRYTGFLLILLTNLHVAFGQNVESKLSENTISLGEKFMYTIEVECKPNDKINYQPATKSIPSLRANSGKSSPDSLQLEILSPFKEKIEKIQGKTFWIGEYSLICFDTGYLIIPPSTLVRNDQSFEIPPALLRVNLVEKNNKIDLYDIEENFTLIPEPELDWKDKLKTFGLWFLLLTCMGALIYYILYIKKKKRDQPTTDGKLSSHEKTRTDLEALMQKEMWRNNLEKEHFTELSLIIRRYLNEEFNNRFEGKTSFEIQLILRNEHFSAKQLTNLGLILNVSDMVKFAKSSVEELGIQTIYQKAIEFVNDLENK